MAKNIWMKVTTDEYELPLAVADTCRELAELCNTTKNSIYCSMCWAKKHKDFRCQYIKIEVSDDDE